MATDFQCIPIIDVSPLVAKFGDADMADDAGVIQVVKLLHKACKEVGFFYVKGHGIPESMIEEVRLVTHKFFSLPLEEKLKIKLSPETGYRGFQEVGVNITKGALDVQEAIDCYKELKPGAFGDLGKPLVGPNLWPFNPHNFKVLMQEYIEFCTGMDSTGFQKKIMRGIAMALGLPVKELEGNIAGDPFWVIRLIGYPVISKENVNDNSDNRVGCGAHTDYGLLTLINQDENIEALQVCNHSGEWIWAPSIPGTFVCNIGDMLKILSNGLYESTLHRVIHKSSKYRVSVAYFYEPNYDAVIEPLDMCVKNSGGIKKLGHAVYGKHLVGKMTTNFRFT